MLRCILYPAVALMAAAPLLGTMTVTATATGQIPLLVGDPIKITTTVAGQAPGNIVYQLSISQRGGPFQVAFDYNHYSSFAWTPSAGEGTYVFKVAAMNVANQQSATTTVSVNVQTRVVNGQPVVSSTANPLVALYSAPACPAGSTMYVVFNSGGVSNHTDARNCLAGISMNFYIAGMLANTTYNMHSVVVTGSVSVPGPVRQFTTGSIPPNLLFPEAAMLVPPNAQTATSQSVLLMDQLSLDSSNWGAYYFPTAIDLNNNVIWYYSALGNSAQRADYSLRPVPGGTIMLNAADPQSILVRGQIWREIDLAGNTIRETNATRISAQLKALGRYPIIDFDHDSIRLPNGHTLILCSQEQIFPAGTQGSPVPIDILGNAVVDLDQNLQIAWSWSGYDQLDVNRAAILGELCAPNTAGCPPMTLAPFAADWMHGNSLNYIPSNGELLISVRNQDWVVKVDYDNGVGTGAVMWRMGIDGDFTNLGTDAFPWFTHQHDVEYELNGTTILSLFDNGNTRAAENPGVIENSRGMVLSVDEDAMTVTPILSQDLGVYCGGVGSAQRLDNGDYHFTAGFVDPGIDEYAQHQEYTLNGVETYGIQEDVLTYRSYRMDSLYQLDGKGN